MNLCGVSLSPSPRYAVRGARLRKVGGTFAWRQILRGSLSMVRESERRGRGEGGKDCDGAEEQVRVTSPSISIDLRNSLSCCRRPLRPPSDGLGREPKTASWLLIANFKHSALDRASANLSGRAEDDNAGMTPSYSPPFTREQFGSAPRMCSLHYAQHGRAACLSTCYSRYTFPELFFLLGLRARGAMMSR